MYFRGLSHKNMFSALKTLPDGLYGKCNNISHKLNCSSTVIACRNALNITVRIWLLFVNQKVLVLAIKGGECGNKKGDDSDVS